MIKIHRKEGWQLNPNDKVVDAIINRIEKNNGECPCHNPGVTREERLCPCKSYLEEDKCCCSLYIKEQWIKVEDKLPEDGKQVCVLYRGKDNKLHPDIAHIDVFNGYPPMWYSNDSHDLPNVEYWTTITFPNNY